VIRCFLGAILLLAPVSAAGVMGQANAPEINCSTAPLLKRPSGRHIISIGVVNGKALELVKPKYPAAARSVGAFGTVEVQILIDDRGCVNEAKAISGHPLLRAESIRAAEKSRFSPTMLSHHPIWVYGMILYHYRQPK